MRYYDIKIFNSDGTIYREYSSLKNGVFNPGALMVEFDILRFGESTPQGESHITVWGISPQEMQQARQNMSGKRIQLFSGMSKGLPLANPQQRGLVIDGTIFQAFGNWQGTELRLDFIIFAGPVSSSNPAPLAPVNLTLPWLSGQKLSVALSQCFMTLGGYKPNINISNRLILNYDRQMYCGSLTGLAKNLKDFSLSIIKDPGYSGVEMTVVNGNELRVTDNDYANHPDQTSRNSAVYRNNNPIQIEFSDLIGQPTWIRFGVVTLACVMRADIQVGDVILMPKKSRPMIQASSYSQFRDDAAFSGSFKVQSVRLVGNNRQRDGGSWITIIEANPEAEFAKK